VADNASTDGSVELLKQKYPQVQILQLPSNEGYAGGYNQALEKINADYAVLLNSDVEVTEGWLEPVVDFMERNPLVAACQPKIKSYHNKDLFEYAGAAGGFIDRYGYPFCRGRMFDTVETDAGQYNDPSEIFWASGACLFIRTADFRACGGFDDSFFAHMEEIDLCWRMKKKGYKICYVPGSTVYHVGGGTLEKVNPRKTFLNFRNNLKMLRKNLDERQFKQVMKTRFFLDMVAAVKNLVSLQAGNFSAILKAYRAFLKETEFEKPSAVVKVPLSGVYNGSIVWQYYAKGKKRFTALDQNEFQAAEENRFQNVKTGETVT
jgi:GT2 family glycosyltransferase